MPFPSYTGRNLGNVAEIDDDKLVLDPKQRSFR
jgi:Tfp pilus assembly protein PilP